MAKKETTWTYETMSRIHLNLWRLLAVLPFKEQNLNYWVTRSLFVYFHISNVIYNTMYVGHGVRMLARHSFEIDYICEEVMVQSLSLRYVMLFLKRRELMRLMETCKELWKYLTIEESKTVKIFESKVHYYRNFFFWNSFTVVVMFMATAQFVRIPPATVNDTETRILPFGFYVDVQTEPAYTIVWLSQGLVCVNAAFILTGIETIGPFLIMMACGYLRSIQNRLLSMNGLPKNFTIDGFEIIQSRYPDDKLLLDDALDCARFHQSIMKFCEDIERFMRILYMTTITCSVYNISLIGIQLLKNDEFILKYSSLLALNFMQLFICQWAPEHLLNESEAIGNAAYFATLSHQQYDSKANKILLLIMLRAQKPIQLTAGGYINLSMETFGHMITNAFSFFTVVRNFSF